MSKKFPWRAIDVDDYVCDWNGLTLRAEMMDTNFWWWCVRPLDKINRSPPELKAPPPELKAPPPEATGGLLMEPKAVVADEKKMGLGWEFHDTDAALRGFPFAETWQQACYFAELFADDIHRHGAPTLGYLKHVKLSNTETDRLRRKRRGPKYADFPNK